MHHIDTGTGHLIFWVHGFPLSSEVFREQLAIPGVRHIVPDLSGYGKTRWKEHVQTLDDYATECVALLDELAIDRAVFAGVSMGGYICFAIARMFPDRVRALILIDTKETADTPEGKKGRYDTIEKVRASGTGALVDAMLPKMITPAAPPELRDRVKAIMESASKEGAIASLGAMAQREDSNLASIKVPTLIVIGEQDTIATPADAERMKAGLADATLVRLDGAAHLSMMEKPREFNDAVSEFVQRLT
jgi:3-oxoadipate enol-lactonase